MKDHSSYMCLKILIKYIWPYGNGLISDPDFCYTDVLNNSLHHPLKGIAPTKVTRHKVNYSQCLIKIKVNISSVSKFNIFGGNFAKYLIICLLVLYFSFQLVQLDSDVNVPCSLVMLFPTYSSRLTKHSTSNFQRTKFDT